jgi:hypothetical protein
MIGQFVVIEGPDKGKSYQVEPGKAFLIGRGQNSDTKLTDPSVSGFGQYRNRKPT